MSVKSQQTLHTALTQATVIILDDIVYRVTAYDPDEQLCYFFDEDNGEEYTNHIQELFGYDDLQVLTLTKIY